MTMIIKTISWTRADGKQTTVTIAVARGYKMIHETINADGDKVEIQKREVVESTTISLISGDRSFDSLVDISSIPRSDALKSAEIVLSDGNGVRMGIMADNAKAYHDALSAATTEAEADLEWAEILARRADHARYEAKAAQIENMMTLGEKTY